MLWDKKNDPPFAFVYEGTYSYQEEFWHYEGPVSLKKPLAHLARIEKGFL